LAARQAHQPRVGAPERAQWSAQRGAWRRARSSKPMSLGCSTSMPSGRRAAACSASHECGRLRHTTGRARPVDDTDPVGSDQNIAGVKVTVAQAIAGRQPAGNPQRECPQLRRQDGVFDASGQDLAKVGKISRGVDGVDGKAGPWPAPAPVPAPATAGVAAAPACPTRRDAPAPSVGGRSSPRRRSTSGRRCDRPGSPVPPPPHGGRGIRDGRALRPRRHPRVHLGPAAL
jgi:hypothetical protein